MVLIIAFLYCLLSRRSIVAFNFLLTWLCSSNGNCDSPEIDLSKADEHLSENRFKEAAAVYRQLLDYDETGDTHIGLVFSLNEQSDRNSIYEAESVLKSAHWKYRNQPKVIATAGYFAFLVSRKVRSPAKKDLYMEASKALCRLSIKRSPELVHPLLTLSLIEANLGEYKTSSRYLNKAIDVALQKSKKPWAKIKTTSDQKDNFIHHCLLTRIALHINKPELVILEYKNILDTLGVRHLYYPNLQNKESVRN